MSLFRTKTFWTGAAALVAAAGGFFTGEATAWEALQTALTGLVAIFLRGGMLRPPAE
jgi:hypothetical protein